MQTIFCVYRSDELYPRFVRAAADPEQAWDAILARTLDWEDDDVSTWCRAQIEGGYQVAKYDLQTEVEDDQVVFFVEYWETLFAGYAGAGGNKPSEDVRSAVDRVIAALRRDAGSVARDS
ncbi:MAG: hypothetical protein WBA25_16855 [Jannaschia sp.]